MKLQNKVSIITGSARGIGRATAIKFAAEGATVVVCDLDQTSVDAVVKVVTEQGGKASGFVVDVTGTAKTWAREFGRNGIRANAVCPGMIETDIIKGIPDKVMQAITDRVPLGRLGKPEEIANTYAFLASDEASVINGAVIEVSGGGTV